MTDRSGMRERARQVPDIGGIAVPKYLRRIDAKKVPMNWNVLGHSICPIRQLRSAA
jgi:hypothetical protein